MLLSVLDYWNAERSLASTGLPDEAYRGLMQARILHALGVGLLFLAAAVPVFFIYHRSRLDYVEAVERDAEEAREIARELRIYKTLLEVTRDGVSIGLRSKKTGMRPLTWCNDAYVRNSGYSREELLAQEHIPNLAHSIWNSEVEEEPIPPGEDPPLLHMYRRHGESVWHRPDGAENVIEWHAVIFDYGGDDEWVLTVDRDVTEARRVQKELERSERMHRAVVENAFDGLDVAVIDRETGKRRLESCNDRFVEMSGFTRDELMAMDNLDDHVECHYVSPRHDVSGADPVLGGEEVWRLHGVSSWKRPDGKENYYQWHATYVTYEDHYRVIGADRDITEQRRALRNLERSEHLYRTTVENSFDGINVFLIDPETKKRRLVSCNDRYAEMSGRTREELMACEDLMQWQELVWESSAEEREPGVFVCHGVCSWKRPDDKENYYEWNACYSETPEGIRVIGADRDITERVYTERERRELESRVQHTQKLESLGVLAGGIAHDFNNLLIGILGNADLASRHLPRTSEARSHVTSIERAATRAADLCRQMLAYSGKGRFVVEQLDLSEVVQEMGQLLSVSASRHITVRYDLTEDLPAIEADATQLRQVAMNLITNAAEAIGDRTGMITISTRVVECDANYLKTTYVADELREGQYVCLEVSDNGCGMDQKTVSRLFEPFFTTKFTGRGLGMAAVLGIVRGHKGAIKVYSELGKGTTFRILFPACDGPVVRVATESVSGEAWQAKGTVLLVDDEEIVRNVATEMLQSLGFEVITACDGLDALEVFRREKDRISLVVLDMTMPRMGGEDAFRELRAIRSSVPILLSSGYNEQDVVNRFAGKGLAGFIQKPYQTRTLRQVIQNTLEQNSPS